MRLSKILVAERVDLNVCAASKHEALGVLARLLATSQQGMEPETVYRVLQDREALASTAVGDGVAIPHGRHDDVADVHAAVAICPSGVPFDAVDGGPVRILVGVIARQDRASVLLKSLAHVSRVLRDAHIRRQLLSATSPSMAFAVLTQLEQQFPSIPPPPLR